MVFFAAVATSATLPCVATNEVVATSATLPHVATNVVVATSAALPHEAPPAARPQCEATTKSGNRCSRKAAPGEKMCRQHLKSRRRNAK